jgi:hypothetical protein
MLVRYPARGCTANAGFSKTLTRDGWSCPEERIILVPELHTEYITLRSVQRGHRPGMSTNLHSRPLPQSDPTGVSPHRSLQIRGGQMSDLPTILSASQPTETANKNAHASGRVSDISFMFHYRVFAALHNAAPLQKWKLPGNILYTASGWKLFGNFLETAAQRLRETKIHRRT